MASQLYARIPTYSISHLITVSSVPASVDLVCSLLRREMKGDPFFFLFILESLHLLQREPWTGRGYLIERFWGLLSARSAETFLKGDGFIFLENLCHFICWELLETQGREAWKVFSVLAYCWVGSGVEWIDNINNFSVVWVCCCSLSCVIANSKILVILAVGRTITAISRHHSLSYR